MDILREKENITLSNRLILRKILKYIDLVTESILIHFKHLKIFKGCIAFNGFPFKTFLISTPNCVQGEGFYCKPACQIPLRSCILTFCVFLPYFTVSSITNGIFKIIF